MERLMNDKGLKEDAKGYHNNNGIHILAIGVAHRARLQQGE